MLLGGAFTCVSGWCAGAVLLEGCGVTLLAEEMLLFRFVCGAACTGWFIFWLCAIGVAKAFTLVGLGVVLMVWAWRVKTRSAARFPPFAWPRAAKWLLFAAMLAYFIYYLPNALAPEASPDGATYHLGLVKQYLQTRGFGRITTNMYASFPEGMEMLFLMAFSIGRHSAAALVEFAFLAALPFAMFSYSRRFGFGTAGVAAAVWIFVSPVFAIDGTSAYNDVAGACVVFCVYYLLRIWETEQRAAFLCLAGLLAGFAYAIKYSLFPAVVYAAGFVIWRLWREPRRALRSVGLLVACAAAVMLPWMLKNWITMDNPFSPFLNAWFPNPYITIAAEQQYLLNLRMAAGVSGFSRLWNNLMTGTQTAGLLGPVFLLSPMALVAAKWREGRMLLLLGALLGLTAVGNSGTRFLMPAAPFVALSAALGLSKVRGAIPASIAGAMILCWPTVVSRYCGPGAWRLTEWPVADALRIEPEPQILNRRLHGGYDLVKLIDATTPPGSRIYSIGSPPEAYINRQIIGSYQSAYSWRIQNILWTPLAADWQPTRRIRFAFAPHAVRRIRVLQTAEAHEEWSISEFRVFNGSEELARSPDWRLSAEPDPWTIQLAFDASPVTRWRSAETIRNRMWIGLDFGHLQALDAVVLNCSHDQWSVRMVLQEETSPGTWKTLNSRPAVWDERNQWDLRKAAADEIRRMGMTHVLILNGEYGSDELSRRASDWGLTMLGEAGGYKLYRF